MKELFEFVELLDDCLAKLNFKPGGPGYPPREPNSTPPFVTFSGITLQHWKDLIARSLVPGRVEYELLKENYEKMCRERNRS